MGTTGKLEVPSNPIIPFIIGDGIGPDIWHAAVRILNHAIQKEYGNSRQIEWMEVLAGEKAFNLTGSWLPKETIEAFDEYLLGIKGPLSTPIGGGIRSLNVALRKALDLYVCLRPTKWYPGVPSPVKSPEKVDMVIFRENTEDIYAGIEFAAGTQEAHKLAHFLNAELQVAYNFNEATGLGIKIVSEEGSKRLVRAAIMHAIAHQLPSVTIVHKGKIIQLSQH